MDFSIFLTVEAWISLITLIFLEIVLGVDNLVFITITSGKLPSDKQSLGRKLGLAGALVTRCIFLCFASFLVHMVDPLFTLDLGFFVHGFSVRDIIMLLGGLYLIYKGFAELREVLSLAEEREAIREKTAGADDHAPDNTLKRIGLPQAIATIMVMDIVFSIDSVITAVGMAEHLIIMILAVMIAVILMMVFIDQVSNFINNHSEMKILALTFITVIGVLLACDGLGIHSGIEVMDMHGEKLMVYFAMVFAFVLECIQIRYNSNLAALRTKVQAEAEEIVRDEIGSADGAEAEIIEQLEGEDA